MIAKGLEGNGAKFYIIGWRLAILQVVTQAVHLLLQFTPAYLLTESQKQNNISPTQRQINNLSPA